MGHQATLAAIRAANVIFSINPADAEALQPVVGEQTRLVDLPAFVDTAAYRRMSEQHDRLRRELAYRHKLETGHLWLLSVAMMRTGDKLASYRLLGEALEQLLDLYWQLIVVGDGNAREEVVRALAPLGEDRVRFVGAQSETGLPPYYGAADLCVWPAVNEAYGMALLEAQAAGLPVVAGGAGGVSSIVESGITGLLSTPGDASAFARALRNLIDTPKRRAAMARAAFEKTRTLHDIASAAQILDRALHQALATWTDGLDGGAPSAGPGRSAAEPGGPRHRGALAPAARGRRLCLGYQPARPRQRDCAAVGPSRCGGRDPPQRNEFWRLGGPAAH